MVSLGPPQLDMPLPNRRESKQVDGGAAGGNLSTASATGNPRNKVALAPGRSLLDWVRLGKGNVDLSGTGGHRRDVTAEELAKHCTVNDAWTALKGNVYNITPYLEYHPGGQSELMRAAGIDCTRLFDEVHRWVNYETMLAKCYIGKFIPATDTPKSARRDTKLEVNLTAGSGALAVPSGALAVPSVALVVPTTISTDGVLQKNLKKSDVTDSVKSTPYVPRYEWFQTDSSITLVIYTKCTNLTEESVIIELQDHRNLSVKVFIEDYTFHARRILENKVTTNFSVSVDAKGKVDIVLMKNEIGSRWSTLGRRLADDGAWQTTATDSINYWSCTVESVQAITHDTNLYCFRLPPGARMVVPVGRHIFVTTSIDGMNVVHSYTVVPPSLLGNHPTEDKVQDGSMICLMVKIYPLGIMTPLIGQLQPGNFFNLSSTYGGDFDVQRLASVHQCILFAAGSGFTPMSAILRCCRLRSSLTAKCKLVRLVFFNKTERDILWKEQLDQLASTVDWFQVDYVLSAVDSQWSGARGHLCKELFERYVPSRQSDTKPILLCVCGPTPFTQLAISLTKECGLSDEMIHAFLG